MPLEDPGATLLGCPVRSALISLAGLFVAISAAEAAPLPAAVVDTPCAGKADRATRRKTSQSTKGSWHRRLAARLSPVGGQMDRIIREHQEELNRLCAQYAVRRLEVFGSAATGRFDSSSSDLDFLVELEPGTPGELAEHYLGLLEDLEGLFARPIDLVMTKAVRNPYFLKQIESSRTLLYAA